MMKQIPIPTFLLALAIILPDLCWGQQPGQAVLAGRDQEAVAPGLTPQAVGIENFSVVDDSTGFAGRLVGLGGATDPSSMSWLKESGFQTVINLRRSTEKDAYVDSSRAAAEAVDLRYFHLPVDADTVDWSLIDSFIAEVGNHANQPVYVHCGSATRAAALWMVARVIQDDWPIELAAEEARTIAGKPEKAIEIAEAYLTAIRQQ